MSPHRFRCCVSGLYEIFDGQEIEKSGEMASVISYSHRTTAILPFTLYPADDRRFCLGPLSALEEKGLYLRQQIFRVSEFYRRRFIKLSGTLRLLLREHPALSRTDAGTGATLAFSDRAPKLVGHQEWNSENKQFLGFPAGSVPTSTSSSSGLVASCVVRI